MIDNKTRAEKIVRERAFLFIDGGEELWQEIIYALDEAQTESYLRGIQTHPCCCESKEDCDHEDDGFAKGFASARNMAAEIIEKEYWMVRSEESEAEKRLADLIRKMKLGK